ncbi:MAG: iron chelate uptake ABC transporter family permease subunit [Oscillospiraceae bacterium]|jgi:iron complex transport system permease protein|nr:iron chelate uptake ABC transporter family permease subunit [Oscillospiraceae bacterium]
MNLSVIAKVKSGNRSRRRRWTLVTLALAIGVAALAVAHLIFGRTIYPLSDVIRVIYGENIQGASFAVGTLRIPRMLAGLFAGFAFGAAGSVFQTMLGNPLASPDIIGVSSGASAAAVFCILVLRLSGALVSLTAVTAGILTAALIYLLSRSGEFAGGRLILIGIGVGTMLNAVVSYLLLRASQYDIPAAFRWLSGSLNGTRLIDLPPLIIAVAVFFPPLLYLGRSLRALELGDNTALALGVSVNRVRLILIVCAVALVAFPTSVTGPIAFVAFLSGPIALRMAGTARTAALPAGFVGAALVLAADLIGQFAFDTKFPVGVITGIIGAPYLIFLLIRINLSGGHS